MDQGEIFKRKNRPTIQQLQYLSELKEQENKRGIVSYVAQKCQVNHSSVSRFFKDCCQNGFLTEKYELTEAGENWISSYEDLMEKLLVYLKKIGIPEREQVSVRKDMIENMDYSVLTAILRNDRRGNSANSMGKRELFAKNILEEVLKYGNRQVYFMFYQTHRDGTMNVSMANRGFQKPGLLRHNKRTSRLELTVCEMKAHSRFDGQEMIGKLESLKYEYQGILHQAELRGDTLLIPLNACSFHRRKGGGVKGFLPVVIDCSVGFVHMPESTALLVFWM